MNSNSQSNNKRIAKNTLMLYVRTMFVMVVSLFTSRVILRALGVEDFGIYNVVGGFVSMFSVISGALSSSISRYLTYELGKGSNTNRLKNVFCTSLNILFGIGLIVLVIGEFVGLWFLNNKMNLPAQRLFASNIVLQCSLIAFIINLISVPYNAAIIAHEKMSAFAYISILEVVLKLIIAYAIYITPGDKLIVYSILYLLLAVSIRFTYSIYCNLHFAETRYSISYDKTLVKEMTGFAGWSFFTNCAYIFNTQGVNMLINIFFGVSLNAARAISVQVESAIKKFVTDFTTAINPQITKNYASGNLNDMYKLICRGAKFSYMLLLMLSLPFIFETPMILKLWLNIVPEHTVSFFRLSIIGTMIDILGNTGYTACIATGKIKKYVLIMTSVGCLVFPLTWIAYHIGLPVETCYIIFIMIYIILDVIRLFLMKELIDFPIIMFFKEVICRIIPITIISLIAPLLVTYLFEPSIARFLVNSIMSMGAVIVAIMTIGLTANERNFIMIKLKLLFPQSNNS